LILNNHLQLIIFALGGGLTNCHVLFLARAVSSEDIASL
jgi:hypothetical protein